MKLFRKNKKSTKNDSLQITESDIEWIESNIQWMIKLYGYPKTEEKTISEKWFPNSFKTKNINIENLIEDFCSHFDFNKNDFIYEITEDLRDVPNVPYSIEGKLEDCYLYIDKFTNKFKISLSKNIFHHPDWLISKLSCEFSKAKLIKDKITFDTGTDTNLFLYLVSVYFGYGVIISKNLTEIGVKYDGFWETKWSYISDIPYQVIAYALATNSTLKKEQNPKWKSELPKKIIQEFELSIEYIKNSKNKLFNERVIENSFTVNNLFEISDKQYKSNEINRAISTLQKIIFLTNDNILKADVYNNIGYFNLRLEKIENSIVSFEKALSFDPNFGYANDNLGFALIISNKLEEGKRYLEKAIQSENNDDAYSHRNLGIYFQRKGQFEEARTSFEKAFSYKRKVDLLNFYFGLYLIETNEIEQGMKHIKTASELGENEAIKYLKTNNTNPNIC